MAARPIWRGQIRLALVSIPVELYSATKSGAAIQFHQVHEPTGKRIKYEKVVPGVGPVDRDEIVKGYEVSKGHYVLLDPEEIESVKLESRKTVDLVEFVDMRDIDPMYYDKPYFVVPADDLAEEAYVVIRDALKDSKNAYLWKFNRRRLEAEEIRDSLLAVSGNLDPAPGGEPPFAPEMSWRYTQHQPFIANEKDFATNKRSVYLMQQRIRRQPFLDLFDGADPNSVSGVRPLTTTALQALYTMNDPFFHEQADALAVRVGLAYGSDAERLNYAFRLLYGRTPSQEELRDARQFLSAAHASLSATAVADDRKNREALASLMRVLLSSSEFFTLD